MSHLFSLHFHFTRGQSARQNLHFFTLPRKAFKPLFIHDVWQLIRD